MRIEINEGINGKGRKVFVLHSERVGKGRTVRAMEIFEGTPQGEAEMKSWIKYALNTNQPITE